jgi:hypothetical protein
MHKSWDRRDYLYSEPCRLGSIKSETVNPNIKLPYQKAESEKVG